MDNDDAFSCEWFKCNKHVFFLTIKTNFDQQKPGIHVRKLHTSAIQMNDKGKYREREKLT